MPQHIAINTCFGGFALSAEACRWLASERGWVVLSGFEPFPGFIQVLVDQMMERDGVDREWAEDEVTRRTPGILSHDSSLFDPGAYYFRDNADLVAVIQALGEKASTRSSKLKVVEIPDGVKWNISEYDGKEIIEEVHRSWR